MRRDDVLARLRADEPRLRVEFAVKSLALFGSAARDEAADGSDVDLLIEYARRVGLFHHVATALHLEALLGVPKVDLVFRDAVIDDLRPIIEGEAIDVFGPAQVEVSHPAHA
jgi:predicted nucleotidyltransferase